MRGHLNTVGSCISLSSDLKRWLASLWHPWPAVRSAGPPTFTRHSQHPHPRWSNCSGSYCMVLWSSSLPRGFRVGGWGVGDLADMWWLSRHCTGRAMAAELPGGQYAGRAALPPEETLLPTARSVFLITRPCTCSLSRQRSVPCRKLLLPPLPATHQPGRLGPPH